MHILMVGFSKTLFNSLKDTEMDLKITVVEERELYFGKKMEQFSLDILNDVIFTEYQQSELYIEDITRYIKDTGIKIDAVIPGLEYAVAAAAETARILGLKNSNISNNDILINKLLFRLHCKKFNLPQPDFQEVKSVSDIYNFWEGNKVVLKPANRQASLGVIKIASTEEIESAWNEVLSIDEGIQMANREMKHTYLVERCMFGQEISSEVFVKEQEISFMNLTDKIVTEGKYSVELGHIVPSQQSSLIKEEIKVITQELINSLGYQNGVMHIEWILTDEGPKIIECAGRAAGDQIFNLIKLAYNFNPYEAFIKIMANEEYIFPKNADKVSAIRFLKPISGVLKNISGLESFEFPNIINWGLKIKVGDRISEYRSSWDRIGHFITVDKSYDELEYHIKKTLDNIKLEVVEENELKSIQSMDNQINHINL